MTLLASPRTHPAAEPPNAWVDPDNTDDLIALQREIEAGVRVLVVGQPVYYGSKVRVPLFKEPRRDPAGGGA